MSDLPIILKYFCLFGSLFYIVVGFPQMLFFSVVLDDEGISLAYTFGKKILRTIRKIKWDDVAEVAANRLEMFVVMPRLPEPRDYAFKEVMQITKIIKNRKELVNQIIKMSKNPYIHDSAKALLVKQK